MNTENLPSVRCPACGSYNAPDITRCTHCDRDLRSGAVDREFIWTYRPTRFRSRHVQLFTGLLFSAFMTYLVYFLTDLFPGSLVHQILVPEGIQMLLPVVIVALTFWPLGVVLIRLVLIVRDQNGFSEDISDGFSKTLPAGQNVDPSDLAVRVKSLKSALNPILHSRITIVRKALEQQDTRSVLERRFETESDLDDAEMDGNYALIHLFIWALPILGFLGTVIGITLAVSDFSGFLGGNIDDIDLIKSELGQVTNGLSFAFGTTILGLAGALIVMLVTSITQNYEMGFGTRIRRFCVETLVPLVNREQPVKPE